MRLSGFLQVVLEGPVSIKSLWSAAYINGVDIDYIVRNSLKKYSETPQVILHSYSGMNKN